MNKIDQQTKDEEAKKRSHNTGNFLTDIAEVSEEEDGENQVVTQA